MRIALFQPCYPHGKSQTYLPGGLMNLGSRLLSSGFEVSLTDLNHDSLESGCVQQELNSANVIGFSVLGPPYIPGVVRNIEQLRSMGYRKPIFVGGEGVARLQCADFTAWFGSANGVVQIKNDSDFMEAVGIQIGIKPVTSSFETSMVPMLKRLPRERLTSYLTREFALFMSNGCIFNCNFCAALKGKAEEYRTIESLEDEVDFIASHLASVGHPYFTAYVTNLDMFQNPGQLEERFAAIHRICERHAIVTQLRGLATSKFTVVSCRKDPELPHRLHRLGLQIVGFGADGASEETWRRENKRHNSLSELEEAFRTMKSANILPEMLMVLGFQGSRPREIFADLRLSFRHALRKTVIRPYLAKSRTPSGRWPDNDPQVELFRKEVSLLDRLDYAMLGSRETHPRWQERWLANLAYLTLIGILAPFGLCPTSPLVPVSTHGYRRTIARSINRLMPFDR
jgi:hypothetical protein